MRILVVSDLHGKIEIFQEIIKQNGSAEVLVLPGDITHFGPKEALAAIARQAQERGLPILAVAGNCDTAEVDAELARLGIGLDGTAKTIADAAFHGVSATPPWQSRMYHRSEEEIAQALQAGFRQLGNPRWHVLVCHVPPRETKVDKMYFGQHGGSMAIRQFVDQHQPHLVLCGHIHEGRGVDQIGRTIVVNAGHGARGYYAVVDLGPEGPPSVILGRVV
ncbi:MAG: metallophosphoesterase family protein [Thermoguttaceae bacterium]|nr:metallophosphoesterase family protein [Thermoguttaceae bacterium]MDW8077423.1 metallophosphoesterase family protein [Thermoguttaceae bacterium]